MIQRISALIQWIATTRYCRNHDYLKNIIYHATCFFAAIATFIFLFTPSYGSNSELSLEDELLRSCEGANFTSECSCVFSFWRESNEKTREIITLVIRRKRASVLDILKPYNKKIGNGDFTESSKAISELQYIYNQLILMSKACHFRPDVLEYLYNNTKYNDSL